LRVLQVNKFFYAGAGAETSFFATRALLAQRGHEVVDFAMTHPNNVPSPYARYFAPQRDYAGGGSPVARLRDASASVYSRKARSRLGRLLDEHPVDVAHLHNVYHQLTLSVVDELAARGIPTVLTLHDWKVACPAYTLFTDGAPCRRCPTSGYANAIRHRCVKGSAAASGLAALEAILADRRGSYAKINRYIAPSRFAVDIAALGGLDRARVDHIPNFLPDEELASAAPDADHGPRMLYVGRLTETKGVRCLLRAFARVDVDAELRIAGDGELAAEVSAAAAHDPRISYLGRLSRPGVHAEYERARAVLMPSLWEDNGPLVVLEAQARSKAMIVSDRGGLREFVCENETGLVVNAGDESALANAMTRLATEGALAAAFGRRAREQIVRDHSADQHYAKLIDTYRAARTGDAG
jgi:glycosyltransferase involved in cell wall biosynthesis